MARRSRNTLALAVMGLLMEGVKHPYEMAQTLRERNKGTSFKITTRLESRPGKDNPDAIEATKTCDLTKLVNDHYTWFLDEPASTCTVPSTLYDGDLWWSSDSTVVYDIEGDGKGPVTKELLGSPLIHG